jgi:hypothetical protein
MIETTVRADGPGVDGGGGAAWGGGAAGRAGAGAAAVRAPPHSPQKRSSGSLSVVPHEGQGATSRPPQPPQNFLPSRFSCPQLPQRTPKGSPDSGG